MTKFYKIETKNKKSIYEYQTYEDKEKGISFQTEEMYRWGYVVIKVEDDEELSDKIGDPVDEYNEVEFGSYDFEDSDVDDQCSFYFTNVKGIDNEKLEEDFEASGYDYEWLRDNYGEPDDFYKVFHGPLKVTDVTDEYIK